MFKFAKCCGCEKKSKKVKRRKICVKELKLDVNDVVNYKYKQIKFEELHLCLWIDLAKRTS